MSTGESPIDNFMVAGVQLLTLDGGRVKVSDLKRFVNAVDALLGDEGLIQVTDCALRAVRVDGNCAPNMRDWLLRD